MGGFAGHRIGFRLQFPDIASLYQFTGLPGDCVRHAINVQPQRNPGGPGDPVTVGVEADRRECPERSRVEVIVLDRPGRDNRVFPNVRFRMVFRRQNP